jgi:hypothetical protein
LSDSDVTPRPTPIVANPLHRPLVLALGHHALVLEQTAIQVAAIKERIAVATDPIAVTELSELGRAFRREADSATDVAKAAEKAAAG